MSQNVQSKERVLDGANDFDRLVNTLMTPEFYPHPVDVITTIETHISIIFLTGPYAYKLKKPVNFGFLDFSTLAKRHQYYQLELALNRRTAPDLYQGIVPIYLGRTKYSVDPTKPNDAPVEYLLQMKQFDPNLVLGRYLQSHELTQTQKIDLVKQIAQLHMTAEGVADNSPFGEPETVLQPMLDNFPPLLDALPHPETQYRLQQLLTWTELEAKNQRKLLQQRKKNGAVMACHGDLHLDNITLIDDKPVLFDGIEFNEAFRWIDRLNDLAFLLIDLKNKEHPTLANWIKNRYLQQTGDYEGLPLLPLYEVYRNLVRAKITALRAQQLQEKHQIQQTLDIANQYILQAEDSAYRLDSPQIILMQGVSGSGKSYVADKMAEAIGAIVLSSDVERKRLFGISPLTRVDESQKQDLYSAQMSQKTYERLFQLTDQLLKLGHKVIVDATFLKHAHRNRFHELGKKLNAPSQVVSIQPSLQTIEDQIRQRTELNNNPSDATIDVMRQQTQAIEWPEAPETAFILHDTGENELNRLKEWLTLPID
jgi:aminoglycoside phosphotransferase family enzyme/predicted kinase